MRIEPRLFRTRPTSILASRSNAAAKCTVVQPASTQDRPACGQCTAGCSLGASCRDSRQAQVRL